jgi:hypothetical protein
VGRFLDIAGQRDIQVHALNGEHNWILDGRQRLAVNFAEAIVEFNRLNPHHRQFSAVHLDVEPHALQAWAEARRQEALLFSLIELLDQLKAVRADLALIIDVPIWFADRTLDGLPLSDVLMRRSDGVVYMAYGTKSGRRRALITQIMTEAAANGRRFWIGLSADRRHLCPYPLAENFEADVDELETALQRVDQFAGVAIHDYDRYRDLILGVEKYGPAGQARCMQAGAPRSGEDS